jgi:hypothetical protein
VDKDLEHLSVVELQEEVMKLRTAIRNHRDQKGDDNCWLDDGNYLYNLLPEKIKCNPELPRKQLMMVNCFRYYDCRKANKPYVPLESLPGDMDFAVEWISEKERTPFQSPYIVLDIETGRMALVEDDVVPIKWTHWFPIPTKPKKECHATI